MSRNVPFCCPMTTAQMSSPLKTPNVRTMSFVYVRWCCLKRPWELNLLMGHWTTHIKQDLVFDAKWKAAALQCFLQKLWKVQLKAMSDLGETEKGFRRFINYPAVVCFRSRMFLLPSSQLRKRAARIICWRWTSGWGGATPASARCTSCAKKYGFVSLEFRVRKSFWMPLSDGSGMDN